MTMTAPSTTERTQLEAELQRRQRQLLAQLADHQAGQSRVEHAVELLNQDGDDAPQRDADREVALARSDRQMWELGQVNEALLRLHQPGFGLCEDCGEAIAPARLRAEPWARRCVACQTQHEGHQDRVRHTL